MSYRTTEEDLLFTAIAKLQQEQKEFAKVCCVEEIPPDLILGYYQNLLEKLLADERVSGKDAESLRVEKEYVAEIEKEYGITLVLEDEEGVEW